MYVYYDSLSDCRDSKHLTSYTTYNSEACYKSFEQLNNTYRTLVRQDTCDANYTTTTFRELDQSKREICDGQKIGQPKKRHISTCKNTNESNLFSHATDASYYGLPHTLGPYVTTYCADDIPFQNKPVNGDSGDSDSNSEEGYSGQRDNVGLILGCVFGSLFACCCVAAVAYYYYRHKNNGKEIDKAEGFREKGVEITDEEVSQSMSSNGFGGETEGDLDSPLHL